MNKFKVVTFVLYTLLLFTFISQATTMFWVGFHAVDISVNQELVGVKFDMHMDGNFYTVEEGYGIGMKNMVRGFSLLFFSFILSFGWVLLLISILIELRKGVEKDE